MQSSNHIMPGTARAPAAEAVVEQSILKATLHNELDPSGRLILQSKPVAFTPRRGLATAVADPYVAPTADPDDRPASGKTVLYRRELATVRWTLGELAYFAERSALIADAVPPLTDGAETAAVILAIQLGLMSATTRQTVASVGHA